MDQGADGGGPAPGWYPDPSVPGQQRWWDGTAWSEHTAPLAGAPGQPAYGQQAWGAAATPHVDTWLWQSIVVTVLCCLPLGLVGVVFASQAQGALNMGNVAEAEAKAASARTFTLIGLVVGPVLIAAWIALVTMGAVAGM